jgi:disulfide bond formation protein DsbB
MTSGSTRLFGGMLVVGVGAVGAALVTQHVFGMQPCAWCVLQRAIFLAIALAGVLGLVWRASAGRVLAALLALALALSGVAAALWQHFVASKSVSCNLTLADRVVSGLGLDSALPAVFAPQASCADAAVKLLGMPYEFWSLGLFVLLTIAAVAALRSR